VPLPTPDLPLNRTRHHLLHKALNQISGKSTMAKAIRYSLSRWTALSRYTTDGRLEMTTNAVERAIRPLAPPKNKASSQGSSPRSAGLSTVEIRDARRIQSA
jgi:transposase